MSALQLEFFSEKKSEVEIEIQDLKESFGRVRRKIFAEITSLKKACYQLQQENLELRKEIFKLKGEEMAWDYEVEGCLFTYALKNKH